VSDGGAASEGPIEEAELVETEAGLKPQGEGWFVVNLGDAAAVASPGAGHAWTFEGESGDFPHFGINVHVLQPGEPSSLYHAEEGQEAFLVLAGECLLIVEEQERRLRQWDFFHAAPWTTHTFVGAGEGPCAILMVGARNAGEGLRYPVSEAAKRHRAGVEEETDLAEEAYPSAGWERPAPARRSWPPG
jgi:uncharacterized cupin superfamily protein